MVEVRIGYNREDTKIRIVSPYRDYYDGLKAHDAEQLPLYIRTPKIVEDQTRFFVHNPKTHGYSSLGYFRIGVSQIGFCGKFHSCFTLEASGEHRELIATENVYTVEAVDKFIQTHYKQETIDHWFGVGRPEHERRRRGMGWGTWTREAFIREVQTPRLRRYRDDYNPDILRPLQEKLFETYKTPIIVAKPVKEAFQTPNGKRLEIEVNPKLKDFDFYRVFSPPLAYQEIRMFLSNMASPEKEIPHISDEIMLEVKGFDKWSFRKRSSKTKKSKPNRKTSPPT